MDETTELRRYVELDAVVKIFQTRRLRLTRVDTFRDPFEGSVPKKQIDDQLPIFSSRNFMMMTMAGHYRGHHGYYGGSHGMSIPLWRDRLYPWLAMTLRRRAKTRSGHASCWTAGPESEAMWRLYCEDGGVRGQGVSLQSTLGTVEASVARHDLFVSPIRYRYYHQGDAFNDELDPFMHKRKGFE